MPFDQIFRFYATDLFFLCSFLLDELKRAGQRSTILFYSLKKVVLMFLSFSPSPLWAVRLRGCPLNDW